MPILSIWMSDFFFDVDSYGLEWGEGEDFEGEKAYYHFWAIIEGTKLTSSQTVEVTLTDPSLDDAELAYAS